MNATRLAKKAPKIKVFQHSTEFSVLKAIMNKINLQKVTTVVTPHDEETVSQH